jgi:hypothetical protein
MGSASINRIIDDFSHLKLDDKEYAADIIRKQLIGAKRESIAKRAREATSSLKKGLVKKGSVKDLHRDLESD